MSTPEQAARQLLGAMNATDPPDPLGWAEAKTADGYPLYLLVAVHGRENIEEFKRALERLKPNMKPVEPLPESDNVDNDNNRG